VYHINAVDTVTQWQVVGCAEKISEIYLVPVLAAVLAQFPFAIRGFHADNGSEYIHHRVAEMLRKLHAEFTKSRACRSQDNALVEGNNGAVIRKLIGYGHIAGAHATALQQFYVEQLKSLSELPPALRLRHSEPGRVRQTTAQIQNRGLPDAVRETAIAAGSGTVFETRA